MTGWRIGFIAAETDVGVMPVVAELDAGIGVNQRILAVGITGVDRGKHFHIRTAGIIRIRRNRLCNIRQNHRLRRTVNQ